MAEKIVKHEFVGAGAAVQALGVAAPFVLGAIGGWVGTVVGSALLLILLIVGSGMSKKVACGACGNRLTDAGVKMCPTCRAEFP